MEKNKLMKEECKRMLADEKYQEWYGKHLQMTNQGYTIRILEKALSNREITVKQALFTAFITGLQWEVKFKGTP